MKFTVAVLACVFAVASAQSRPGRYDPFTGKYINTYEPYRYTPSTTPPTYFPTYVKPTSVPVSVVRVVDGDRNAETLKYGNEINPDGSYSNFFETSNGIAAQAQGVPRDFGGNPPVVPDVAQGSFSWTSPEGKVIVINYIADENGYQPTGEAIPTPPPVPAAILRAIEYNAKFAPQKK